MLSKRPILKIYLSIIIIAAVAFLWINQGLSNEILEKAFKETIKTLKIHNVTIGETHILSSSLGTGSVHGDISRAGIVRYNKIGINITLSNPSDYRLEIRINQFDVKWMSRNGFALLLGGIENVKIIILESGESKTFEIEGLALEGFCQSYLWREIETPEFLFDTHMYATTMVSNRKAISYRLRHNFDGSISSEDYYYQYI